MYPLRRKSGLLVENFDDETVVYDRKTHKAHYLSGTTAEVWRFCDGQTSTSGLAQRLDARLEGTLRKETVQLILKDLEKARLLEGDWKAEAPHYTRRELIGKLKTAGIALGVLSSITASGLAQGQPGQGQTQITQGQCMADPQGNVGKCCTNNRRCQATGKCMGGGC